VRCGSSKPQCRQCARTDEAISDQAFARLKTSNGIGTAADCAADSQCRLECGEPFGIRTPTVSDERRSPPANERRSAQVLAELAGVELV
jgi:hypothetical protein